MEKNRTGFAEVNGTRLAYEVAGEGHPLVLIHGLLVNSHLWDEQFYTFAQHYQAIRYDMRGFGASALITEGMPPYSSSADLYHLLRFLRIEKAYVLGLSAGGALAIDFTIEHPEMVDALITVASGLMGYQSASDENVWPQLANLLQRGELASAVEVTLRHWTDGPTRTPEQVDAHAREQVRAMTTANYQMPNDFASFMPQPMLPPARQRLAEINVPTLVIYGDKDVKEAIEIAHILETEIKGAKKVVIPNTAHHLNLERPADFNRVVLDFLALLASRVGGSVYPIFILNFVYWCSSPRKLIIRRLVGQNQIVTS